MPWVARSPASVNTRVHVWCLPVDLPNLRQIERTGAGALDPKVLRPKFIDTDGMTVTGELSLRIVPPEEVPELKLACFCKPVYCQCL